MEMMVAAVNVIWGGLCERYPRLRFGFMEASGGWMAPWLDRMDHHFEQGRLFDDAALLKMRPSDYFRRQCWISFEPGESTLASAAELLGPSKLLWATDYPHFDGYFPGAPRMVAARLPERIRRDVMAQGAIDFYKLNG
jgi:predicted TIM-barrel fold metal-dependent hydrolase